jgi:hypothetical protein
MAIGLSPQEFWANPPVHRPVKLLLLHTREAGGGPVLLTAAQARPAEQSAVLARATAVSHGQPAAHPERRGGPSECWRGGAAPDEGAAVLALAQPEVPLRDARALADCARTPHAGRVVTHARPLHARGKGAVSSSHGVTAAPARTSRRVHPIHPYCYCRNTRKRVS